MKKEQDSPDKLERRSRAEELLAARPKDEQDFLPITDVRKLTHELEVHQIELETQNEELRRSYQSLEAARDRYSDLYDFAPVGYFTLDEKLLVIEANLTCASLLGVEKRSLMKRGFSHYVAKDYQDKFYLWIKQGCEIKEPQACELKLIRKDGSEFYGQLECMAMQDAKGNSNQVRVAIMDITDRNQAERAVQESLEYAENVVATVREPLVVLDGDLRVVSANRSFYQVFAVKPQETEGQLLYDLGSRQWDIPGLRQLLEEVIPRKNTFEGFEIEHDFPTIGQRIMLLNARRVYMESNKTQLILLAIEDVTDRVRAEEKRKALVTELEAKNEELERFTYTVSHDLKSPLITIKGFLGMLGKDAAKGDTDRMNADMQHISDAADKMERLLRDLLGLSRIGRAVNPPEEVLFGDLAQEAVNTVEGRLKQRGVKVEIGSGLPTVYGDRTRLREALENLVDNAVKFMGDQPEPLVQIGFRRDADKHVFYVQDNGIGIDSKYHEKIFGLFDRLDQEAEGTGVGLAIVRRIVELHGGRIWVESEDAGQGTAFCFTLPPASRSTDEERRVEISKSHREKTTKKTAAEKTAVRRSVSKESPVSMGIEKKYLKRRNVCKVTFRLSKTAAPDAKSVCIVGDFNDWNIHANRMKKQKNGGYTIKLELQPGKEYQFRYLIDGFRWENDWNADRYVGSPYGGSDNSVIMV